MQGILDGIRVLDFGHFIAGPYCGALLADFGADVIRVERPQGNNDRFLMPCGEDHHDNGALYLQVNRNKRSLALDPFSEAARPVLQDLIRSADVVIANLPEPTLKSAGIDYASLTALKPDIILCTCSAYGHNGPDPDKTGFDGIGQAMSGAMEMTGENGSPRKSYAHFVDFSTASLSAFGIVLALMDRTRTGKGQQVRMSLLHTALAVMNGTYIEHAATGIARRGTGNRAQLTGPADCMKTSDGHVLVQAIGGSMFRRWAKLVGKPEWIDDPRFADDQLRGDNGAVLSEAMQAWCADRTSAECLAEMEKNSIPGAPVLAPDEILDHRNVAEGGFFDWIGIPGLQNEIPMARAPAELSETPARLRSRAPMLGEHTGEILTELGYDAARQQQLAKDGLVYLRAETELARQA